MELKHKEFNDQIKQLELLIVPYGIETKARNGNRARSILLIVPYGIETEIRSLNQENRELF